MPYDSFSQVRRRSVVKDTSYRKPKNCVQDIGEITSNYEEIKEAAKGDNGNRGLVVCLPVQCQKKGSSVSPSFCNELKQKRNFSFFRRTFDLSA